MAHFGRGEKIYERHRVGTSVWYCESASIHHVHHPAAMGSTASTPTAGNCGLPTAHPRKQFSSLERQLTGLHSTPASTMSLLTRSHFEAVHATTTRTFSSRRQPFSGDTGAGIGLVFRGLELRRPFPLFCMKSPRITTKLSCPNLK